MLAAAGGAVSAALGAFGLWLANRMLGKAAFQTAINSGFKDLVDQLQEERKASQDIIHSMRQEWDAERITTAAERAQLRGEIINLTQTVESLKSWFRTQGIPVPRSKAHELITPEHVMVELKQDGRDEG